VGLAGDEDAIVLDCYWLAQWYHQSPEHFLAMPLSDVFTHVARTMQLAKMRQRIAQADHGD
jgi:hypothetical protein